jgi:hypothetical protein
VVLPPAAGIYHYTQSGSTQAGIISFDADPEGTLAIGAATAAGSAKRQKQSRQYSSGWSQDQILLFGSDAILLEQTTMRFGSGGFVQEQTCKPSHPLKVVPLPVKVGASWSDSGTCNGLTVSLTGKILRTEQRTVGGKSVSTYVLHVVTHTTGDGYDINTDLTTWISSAYRLTVHSVQRSSGTAQGNQFTQNLTENLKKLTPDA